LVAGQRRIDFVRFHEEPTGEIANVRRVQFDYDGLRNQPP
jgi:hypothetical protein